MGARQSVQQTTTRGQRAQTAGAVSNGHASSTDGAAPSTSSVGLFGALRPLRSFSVSVPLSGGGGGGSDSSDQSADDDTAGARLPASVQLDRLLGATRGAAGPSAVRSRFGQQRRLRFLPFFDIKCPVCNKTVASDEAEVHLVMCLTRPRITYNEDVLDEDKGECAICFEDMLAGAAIARLPCLCIYHKACIDAWFNVKNCCPEHPGDD